MKKVWLLALTAGSAALLLGFLTSSHQIGLTEDCLRYLSMAKHVAAGKGFALYNPSLGPVSLPYISQAPLWSAIIALGLAVGFTPEFWLWVCVVTFFGLNLFLAGLTAFCGTRRLSAGLAVQFLVLCDLHLLTHHGYGLSEPLFFLLTQAAVLALWVYLDSGRGRWLAGAVTGVGLIGLARYIGLTYAVGLALGILFFDRGKLMRRIPRGIFWGALGGVPLGLWFVRHFWLRHEWFGMHVPESQTHQFFPMKVAMSFWTETLRYPIANGWLPDRPGSVWVIPTLVILGTVFFIRRIKSDPTSRGPLLLVLFSLVYGFGMIAVWTARSVPAYPDPFRLSAPIFVHLWVFLVIFFYQAVGQHLPSSESSKPRMVLSRVILVLILSWGIGLIPKTYAWMTRAVTTGDYGRNDSIPWTTANRIIWFSPF